MESHFDRFRPEPRKEVWRESGGPGGGLLFDLGPHLIDQALTLFGPPEAISSSVRVERDAAVVDDAFDLQLTWERQRLTVFLRATLTACTPGPRFVLHGTHGSFVKRGLDPQEEQLRSGMRPDSPGFGEEPESRWGQLSFENKPPQSVPTLRGDYRGFYENVRDALLGRAELAVTPEQVWRTTRLIELARESSGQGRRLRVDFTGQP